MGQKKRASSAQRRDWLALIHQIVGTLVLSSETQGSKIFYVRINK